MEEINSNDKLLGALTYPIPLIGIIILLVEDMRNRPFQKYHAVQSIVFNVVLWVVYLIVTLVTFGFGGCLFPVFLLITLWPAYEAYQEKYMELPVITNFIKNQGWV